MEKLERYGTKGLVHKWLKSYRDDTNKYAQFNNLKSNELKIMHGVPQGSMLGPKLLIQVHSIDDICCVSKLNKK